MGFLGMRVSFFMKAFTPSFGGLRTVGVAHPLDTVPRP
jgi:hypothetical protein